LEEEINFLVFWGKVGRESAMKMPRWKRRMWVEMTIKNLKQLYETE
jgi:hypothetical protein